MAKSFKNKDAVQSTKKASNKSVVEQESLGARIDGTDVIFITPLGEKTKVYDEKQALAKIIKQDGQITAHIKCNGNREPFNPYEREYELNSRRISMRLGKEVYHFEKTTTEGLNNYISYLKTRQPKFYRGVLGEFK